METMAIGKPDKLECFQMVIGPVLEICLENRPFNFREHLCDPKSKLAQFLGVHCMYS
jgi:hypothetical protein